MITGRRRRDSTDESPARTATGHYSSPMTQAWVRALTAARLRTRKLGAARRDSGPADLGPAETGTSETGTSETGTESSTSETTVFFRHLPFAAVLLVIVLVVAAVDPARLGDPTFFSATVLGVAATVASMILPWERLPRWSPALVALADMAVVVLIEASGVRCSVLLVLPVLWLSTSFGTAGVVLSITAGTLAVWVPLFAGSMPTTLAERHTLVPLALAAAAIYVFLAERRSSARRALLSKQSALVEEALESANAHDVLLQGILNTIDVGVVALDSSGRITQINRTMTAMVGGAYRVGDQVGDGGLPPGSPEVAARQDGEGSTSEAGTPHAEDASRDVDAPCPPGERTSPDGSPVRDEASVLPRAAAGETIDRELVFVGKGDRELALRVSAAPLTDDDGARTGAVVVYQDVTSETNALAQREEFVSAVSHELRTPLTSVLGFLELIEDTPGVPEEVRAHLRVVARNTDRLLHVISDLLTAAQTRSGQIELTATPVDLREVVTDTVLTHERRAGERGVRLVNRAERQCVVHGDRTRLGQVVDNVVSNAIKYSDDGGTVALDLAVEGPRAHLTVRDEGIGIAHEEQERVFARFYRGHAARSGPAPGVGLGLHITRQLVEAHGGTIDLTSSPGTGTTVDIYLPLEDGR